MYRVRRVRPHPTGEVDEHRSLLVELVDVDEVDAEQLGDPEADVGQTLDEARRLEVERGLCDVECETQQLHPITGGCGTREPGGDVATGDHTSTGDGVAQIAHGDLPRADAPVDGDETHHRHKGRELAPEGAEPSDHEVGIVGMHDRQHAATEQFFATVPERTNHGPIRVLDDAVIVDDGDEIVRSVE